MGVCALVSSHASGRSNLMANGMKGAWLIMCCGCHRLLSESGSMATTVEDAAAFTSKEDGDKAAVAAGWKTEDADGPGNHRCPTCVHQAAVVPPNLQRRGAYVWREGTA